MENKNLPGVVNNTPMLGQSASSMALVQRTLAEVQVAVMMAKTFPRDKIAVKEKFIMDCCREQLAEKAVYSYSKGGTEITGPTIRFAEALKNAWGNIQSGWRELSRMNGVSEIEAFAWDTENNTRESVVFSVKHWRDTKKGGYLITDEREIYELCANQAKRRERACILAKIDGDIIDAGLKQCELTLNNTVQVTPERIKSMIEKFAIFKVTQEMLEKRIQRRIDTINGPLMLSLTRIYNSLNNDMSKAEEWFEFPKAAEPEAKGNEAVKEKLQKKGKAAAAPEAKAEEKPATKPTQEPTKATIEKNNCEIILPDGEIALFPRDLSPRDLAQILAPLQGQPEAEFIRANHSNLSFIITTLNDASEEPAADYLTDLLTQ